jgi:hypothetical protein
MRHGHKYRFDITPRPLSSVFDHKIHSILDCPIDDEWWFWMDDDAFFTSFDTPFSELGISFDSSKILIFPKSPVNPLGGWTFLSSGNFFFRSTQEAHAFFRRVLETQLSEVKEWWDDREFGMFTNGDQDKIVWNLIHDEEIRARTDLISYEVFNTRPYHFSSPTDFFLVHFAVPGVAKEESIKLFQARFNYEDDALLPPGEFSDRAAMLSPYRIQQVSRRSRFNLQAWWKVLSGGVAAWRADS